MAKKAQGNTGDVQQHIPDFVDVDAATVTAAIGALKSGGGWAIPDDAKRGADDKKGGKHYRWSVPVTVEQAYRGVAKSGLMDVTIVVKARPGSPNENKKEFLHLYINTAVMNKTADEDAMKKHGSMTEQSLGVMATLAQAAGLMPKSGAFKASLLNALFPSKNQPGAKSPLDGKSVIVNAHAQVSKQKKTNTNQVTGETTTEEVEDTRISPDSFLPDVADDDEE